MKGMIDAINTALTGMNTATKKLDAAATRIAGPQGGETLAEDIVELSVAKNLYKANVKVVETVNEMTDELLAAFDKKV